MPDSQQQVRWAHAVAEGGVRADAKTKKFANEVIGKMHGRTMSSLPVRASGTSASQKEKVRRRYTPLLSS